MSDDRVKAEVVEGYVFVRLEYESAEARAFMKRAGRRGYPMMFIVDPTRYERAREDAAAGESGIRSLPIRWEPDRFAAALQSERP